MKKIEDYSIVDLLALKEYCEAFLKKQIGYKQYYKPYTTARDAIAEHLEKVVREIADAHKK